MNDSHSMSDRELLVRLDESINGEGTGLKATVQRLDEKLDAHFGNHRRERNAIIAALATAIVAIATTILSLLYI